MSEPGPGRAGHRVTQPPEWLEQQRGQAGSMAGPPLVTARWAAPPRIPVATWTPAARLVVPHRVAHQAGSMPRQWGMSPRESVRGECQRRGETAVVASCLDVLTGQNIDERLLHILSGPAAEQVLDGRAGGAAGYWPRVWAARGLLYAWDESATTVIAGATSDEAWRVREMAAKVIAKHRIGDALDAVITLRDDPVPRVRAAAERAIEVLTATGA